ncbi:MAG: hypothetical protein ACM37W_18545 [Actinomycetota bacterium]
MSGIVALGTQSLNVGGIDPSIADQLCDGGFSIALLSRMAEGRSANLATAAPQLWLDRSHLSSESLNQFDA